jgi:hypothetical protein
VNNEQTVVATAHSGQRLTGLVSRELVVDIGWLPYRRHNRRQLFTLGLRSPTAIDDNAEDFHSNRWQCVLPPQRPTSGNTENDQLPPGRLDNKESGH